MKALTGREKQERQKAILEAATRVLSGKGFDSLTMEEVAREAGMAKGTLFLYYRSKQDLVQAVFAAMAERFGRRLSGLTRSSLPPEKMLGGAITALLEHFDKKRDITGYSSGLPFSGARREALRERFASNMRGIAAILERCSAAGLLELPDPLFAASALFGLCRGSNSYARAAGRRLPVQERARRVKAIFLFGTRKR